MLKYGQNNKQLPNKVNTTQLKMTNHTNLFHTALQNADLDMLKSIPKSDLHNHAPLGSRLRDFEKEIHQKITPPPTTFANIAEMDSYIMDNLRQHIVSLKGLETSVRLAFRQAKNDGIQKLEMSIDCLFLPFFA